MTRFNININDDDTHDNDESSSTDNTAHPTQEPSKQDLAMARFTAKMEKQYQQKNKPNTQKPDFDDDFLNFSHLQQGNQSDSFDDFFDTEEEDFMLSYESGYTETPPQKLEQHIDTDIEKVYEEYITDEQIETENTKEPDERKDFFDDFFDDEGNEETTVSDVHEAEKEEQTNEPTYLKEEEYHHDETIILDAEEPQLNLRDGGAIDIKPPDYEEPVGGGISDDTEKENQSGFNNIPAYNTTVGADGREKGNNSFGDDRKNFTPQKTQEEKIEHVSDPEGKERWTVKVSSGKLDQQGLHIFQNLNRARIGEENEEVLRNVMGAFGNETAHEKRLINRLLYGNEQIKAGSHKRFTSKDRDVLRFLAMFKYANVNHLARIHQVKPDSMYRRLLGLKERGLVQNKDLYGAQPLWFLTTGGHICAGMNMPKITEAGITYTMLPHQFVVNHVAGNLWGGGVNVLALEDFPAKNREKENGEYTWGETVVSEYEIQSSFASIRSMNSKADIYRPVITSTMNREFNDWVKTGGPSPEMKPGNEYMWTLFPPFALKLSYHVPDLVVKRQRTADGKPQSIAVEVELANKPIASYERTLRAYKYDTMIFSKVIWVVKSRGAAKKLQELAQQLGMWKEGRVGIVPIYTEDGVFKGKSEWMI